MAKKYAIQVNGSTVATFTDYEIWNSAQDAMKCARKNCGISWSNSVDCESWTIDYKYPCDSDGYLLTYYTHLESIRSKMKAA